jgi:hypothetical protein
MLIVITIAMVIAVPVAVIVPIMIAATVPSVIAAEASLARCVQISSPFFCLPAAPTVLANRFLKLGLGLLHPLLAFMSLVVCVR